mgnify:CR=1 FL=1
MCLTLRAVVLCLSFLTAITGSSTAQAQSQALIDQVKAVIATDSARLETTFKDLHGHPELGFTEIRTAGLELGPEVVHIAPVRIAECLGEVFIGDQGPAVAPAQPAQHNHRPTSVGPGIGECEPQAHRQQDTQGSGWSRFR